MLLINHLLTYMYISTRYSYRCLSPYECVTLIIRTVTLSQTVTNELIAWLFSRLNLIFCG